MGHASTANLAPDNTTDATFRAWGSAVSGKLAAMGMVQTADTGQINWATVTTPSVAASSRGYEIWRFNDSLQGSLPIYFKIEYGSGTSLFTRPGLWLTVGTGSNGSGTILNANTRFQIHCSATQTTPAPCVFSGATNRVGMVLFKNVSSGAVMFFIERGKASDGTDNNLISVVWWEASKSTGAMQLGNQLGVWGTVVNTTNIIPPEPTSGRSTGLDGAGNVCVYSNMHSNQAGWFNALLTHVGYFNSDITADTTFVVSVYGNPHTFYAIGGTSTPIINVAKNNGNTNMRLAMLYE